MQFVFVDFPELPDRLLKMAEEMKRQAMIEDFEVYRSRSTIRYQVRSAHSAFLLGVLLKEKGEEVIHCYG
jgi:hypothetical protein